MKLHLFIIVVAFVFACACTLITGPRTARTRAANDFACAEESVAVTNIGGESYRAAGCGKQAT
jgi:hypothetical protein